MAVITATWETEAGGIKKKKIQRQLKQLSQMEIKTSPERECLPNRPKALGSSPVQWRDGKRR